MADRVLLVEDDHAVRSVVRMMLEDEGLDVVEAPTGPQALERFEEGSIDLVLLDLRLPGMSGFDVCRQMRRTSEVPIIMVTAQNDSHDVVAGLELGADDYVTKPFNDRELMARVRSQLRRRHSGTDTPGSSVTIGDLVVKVDNGQVVKRGELIALTRIEFRLLCHFATNPNRVWNRSQLLEHVWGYMYEGDGRVVDTHMARLRAKIEDDPSNPHYIQTVRGLGYRMPSQPT
ncbi:MAG TPA: response regulator transcription factor [Ilumatobacteraceae bacterium]